MLIIKKPSVAMVCRAADGIEQIVKSLQLLGQFVGRKVGFEEVADARIAKEVAKELGYKIE